MIKTFRRTFMSVAFFAAAPFSVMAQDLGSGPTLYVDVFQDGSLFLTYDEYLERQRRVLEAQNQNRAVTPLVIAPRTAQTQAPRAVQPQTPVAPRTAQNVVPGVRATTQMSLQDQWSIGAFR